MRTSPGIEEQVTVQVENKARKGIHGSDLSRFPDGYAGGMSTSFEMNQQEEAWKTFKYWKWANLAKDQRLRLYYDIVEYKLVDFPIKAHHRRIGITEDSVTHCIKERVMIEEAYPNE